MHASSSATGARRTAWAVAFAAAALGCASPEGPARVATPVGSAVYYADPRGDERLQTGRVVGVYRCDPSANEARLREHAHWLDGLDPAAVRERCQVAVSYRKVFPRFREFDTHSDFVLLPADWRISHDRVVEDGRTVNVGDVVTVYVQRGRLVDHATRVVRKCHHGGGKPPYVHPACGLYASFDANGYAGLERR